MEEAQTVGLIADVHANLPALEAVLADLPDVDALVHAGDVVGYGPWPDECVTALRAHDAVGVRGNHDQTVLDGEAYESSHRHAASALTESNRAWLDACPDERSLFDDRVTVVHGHPDERFRYTEAADFAPTLLGDARVLVLGHTHRQAKAEFDEGIVVNPGSVGLPRDDDPRAAYAVLDLAGPSVALRHTPYDVDRVVRGIEQSSVSEYHLRRFRRSD
jgi:putative phosphoesterase